MPSIRQPGYASRARGAVALARARLRAGGLARASRTLTWVTALGFAGMAVELRVADGAAASLSGVVVSAAHWIVWLVAVPLALAAAEDRRALDRADGVEALAASRGLSLVGMESARVLAAMAEIAASIAVPVLALAVLTAALAGHVGAALHRVTLGLGVAGFAIVAGVTLGGVGAACGRLGRARGRWLLVAVVVGPWMLADLAGHGAWSIPGALGAVLDFALGLRSSGA
jgi:hypothetical protein